MPLNRLVRRLTLPSAVLTLVLSSAVPAQAAGYKKGSFTKPAAAGVGPAITHNLGETPKALILWTDSKTNESFSQSYLFGFGLSDGPMSSMSVAAASQDNNAKGNSARGLSTKALTILDWVPNLIAEADLQSWNTTSFTLNWTTNTNTTAYVIHFIVIGGGEVSAKVVNWAAPTIPCCTPGPYGNWTVNTIGFRPDVVIHAYAGYDFTAAPATPPATKTSAYFGIGAMTATGGQWANIVRSEDGGNDSVTHRSQQTDAAIQMLGCCLVVLKEASFVSMNADGFTVDFTTTSVDPSQIISLALKGVSAKVGAFDKVTAGQPAAQTVADVGFRPGLVLLSSVQDTAANLATPQVHARFGIGASDGTDQGSSAFVDTNGQPSMHVDAIDKTSKVFMKVDVNDPAAPQAEANLTGFFNNGFTLNWTTNDAVATQILYLAFGQNWQQQSEAQVLSGSYKGNGVDNRFIPVGFVPDLVIVKGGDDAITVNVAVFRTSTMTGDNSKEVMGAALPQANRIQSIDSTGGGGFTVGTHEQVNRSNVLYYWTAFKQGTGKMRVGTYVGTGTSSPVNAITGLGFSPELVFIIPEGANEATHTSSAASTTTFTFYDAGFASAVTLDADGFSVPTGSALVNASGITYHYVAFNDVPGYMKVGSYVGDTTGAGPNPPAGYLDVTSVGFQPEYLLIKRQEAFYVTQSRPASLAPSGTDGSLFFYQWGYGWGRIYKLLSNGFEVTSQSNVNQTGITFSYYAWKRTTQPLLITGSYTGTAANQPISGLNFTPDVVIVKSNCDDGTAVIKTSTMASQSAKPMTGATALLANLIQLDSSGFTVIGADARVNKSGTCTVNSLPYTYYWIAFKGAPGTMELGTYVGTGASQNVPAAGSSLSFSPELVFIMSAGSGQLTFRSSNETLAHNLEGNGGGDGTLVPFLNADGFTVSTTSADVNQSGVTYHYVAWNEIPGYMDVGNYTGTGIEKDIPGVGFQPDYVVIKKRESGIWGVHKPASLGSSVDDTLFFNAWANSGNRIKDLQPDGFRIGPQALVNGTCCGAYFQYFAWAAPEISALTAVRLTAFSAARYDRGVLVQWQTGYEIDNLGFHVYREVNGERARVTRSMVAGSGLRAGQGTAITAERRYAIWDLEANDPTAVYWLEDVDFNGTSTWHGPVTPVDGGLQAPPDDASSATLNDLNKGKRRGKVLRAEGAQLERPSKPGRRVVAATAIETQWALAAQPAVKLGVTRPGWYRVTQPELVAAGLDQRVDPRRLHLVADGVERALLVTGESDGRFDATDAIEFYGTGIDTPSTDTRVYWLVAGTDAGLRIPIHGPAGRGSPASTPPSFHFTVQQKERSIFFVALRNGEEENWFGSFIYAEPTTLPIAVSNLDPVASGAELEVTLRGVNDVPGVQPDHQVTVLVNDVEVGELQFEGQAEAVQRFTLPAGLLVEGTNTVTLVARGGEADYSLVDVIRLSYAHTYRADADLLRFTAEGPGTLVVGGLASAAIRVIDITDPAASQELRGMVAAEGGLWAVTVRVPATGSRTLLAFTDATVATPAFVRANRPSRWHAATQRADYVLVSHVQFAGVLEPLRAARERQGLTTALVDIEDVYDEFSFGEKTPLALRDFVQRARAAWTGAPRFLVLVGDATFDPRDYSGMGDADFVPTQQVPMAQVAFESASDDWFADLDEDGLPELAVGRLSVRTAAQAQQLVAKILAYENEDHAAPWTRDVLLVADQDEASTFERSTHTLRTLVPSAYRVQEVVRDVLGPEGSRRALLDAVNQGQLIVNYAGHGSFDVWGKDGSLLTPDDVRNTWRNGARLPFIVAMNCLNGFFHDAYNEESLAETFLRALDGGAVAVWASSGITDSATQAQVNQELFRLLLGQLNLTVGEAVAAAKRAVTNRDVRRSWIFFGDPAMRLLGSSRPSTVDTMAVATSTTQSDSGSVSGDPGESHAQDPVIESHANAEREPRFARLMDFTGDGRDDVFLYAPETGQWSIAVSGSEMTNPPGQWPSEMQVFGANLNGDRLADLLLRKAETGELLLALSNGDGSFSMGPSAWGPRGPVRLGDFNGDRRDDVLVHDPDTGLSWQCLTGLRADIVCRPGDALPQGSLLVSDFTGDALADVFSYDAATGHWSLGVNDGAGAFAHTSGDWSPGWTVRAANLDGDGRGDLVLFDPASGAWVEAVTIEPGAFKYYRGQGPAGGDIHVLDADSDGRDDLLRYNGDTGEWTIALNVSPDEWIYSSGVWSPGLTIAWGDLNGDRRTDLLIYDPATGQYGSIMSRRPTGTTVQSGVWSVDWSVIGRHP